MNFENFENCKNIIDNIAEEMLFDSLNFDGYLKMDKQVLKDNNTLIELLIKLNFDIKYLLHNFKQRIMGYLKSKYLEGLDLKKNSDEYKKAKKLLYKEYEMIVKVLVGICKQPYYGENPTEFQVIFGN